MRLREVGKRNRSTLAFARANAPTSGREIVGGLRREHPFFGLTEIDFPLVGSATMACFNDDAVVLEAVWNRMLVHERFSMKIWQAIASDAQQVVDIGAYTGIYTIAAAVAGPQCSVLAFEPVPHIFARLIANVAINQFGRVTCINTCISDAPKEVRMLVPIGPAMFTSGSSVVSDVTGGLQADQRNLITARADTLDSALEGVGLPGSRAIAAIKIDVESHEPAVLAGAGKTLEVHRPVVLIEVLQADLLPKLASFLPESYVGRYIIEEDLVLTEDPARFSSSPHSMNALLIPLERLMEIEEIVGTIGAESTLNYDPLGGRRGRRGWLPRSLARLRDRLELR